MFNTEKGQKAYGTGGYGAISLSPYLGVGVHASAGREGSVCGSVRACVRACFSFCYDFRVKDWAFGDLKN